MLNWFDKWQLARINKKLGITITKNNLTLAFTGIDGHGYYKFPTGLDMPISRVSKLQEYLMWINKGSSRNEFEKALDVAEKGLEGGIRDGAGLAKIGYSLRELRNRMKMVIHDELFYNMIACQLVRGDESPTKFNHEIQMQKVQCIKRMDLTDDGFFLHIQQFLPLLNLSDISRMEYEVLMNLARQTRQVMDKQMTSLLADAST